MPSFRLGLGSWGPRADSGWGAGSPSLWGSRAGHAGAEHREGCAPRPPGLPSCVSVTPRLKLLGGRRPGAAQTPSRVQGQVLGSGRAPRTCLSSSPGRLLPPYPSPLGVAWVPSTSAARPASPRHCAPTPAGQRGGQCAGVGPMQGLHTGPQPPAFVVQFKTVLAKQLRCPG